ncbi:MAG: hypothetical protein A2Y40_10630 [Candidatus Margulisbacteria bacterium GWF2_35_9]|nr:MAG: hypothetical protein A2Y40_10630 [Candidatus Margulisbacteria bacterium GWF2_35_9]
MIKIELPIYAEPIEALIPINDSGNISISIYGGFPDSPFNGGRNNYLLDGFSNLLVNPGMDEVNNIILSAKGRFFDTIQRANENRISFYLAFTNMFCNENELSDDNLIPIKRIYEIGKKNGIKNGIIINNRLLEKQIRELYNNELIYISSCTKYVAKDRLLSTNETIERYLGDATHYDYVVLTPQDSRNERVMKIVSEKYPDKFIAIANTYCSKNCNSYIHYDYTSRENKISLVEFLKSDYVSKMNQFFLSNPNCSASRQMNQDLQLEAKVATQVKAGINNFKIGRGIGQNSLQELLSIINSSTHQQPEINMTPDIPGFLYPGEGEKFVELAKSLPKKSVIVEIGTMAGLSSYYWASGVKKSEGMVFSIDPFDIDINEQKKRYQDSYSEIDQGTKNITFHKKYSKQEVKENLDKYHLKGRYRLIHGFSEDVVKNWNIKIDLLFLDGSHNYLSIKQDFLEWTTHLKPGGIVVIHDSNQNLSISMAGFSGPTKFVSEYLVGSIEWHIMERFRASTIAVKKKEKGT